jgi:hypothetical protein
MLSSKAPRVPVVNAKESPVGIISPSIPSVGDEVGHMSYDETSKWTPRQRSALSILSIYSRERCYSC